MPSPAIVTSCLRATSVCMTGTQRLACPNPQLSGATSIFINYPATDTVKPAFLALSAICSNSSLPIFSSVLTGVALSMA